jgi:hypothetical protein
MKDGVSRATWTPIPGDRGQTSRMIEDNFQVAAEWRSRCRAGIVNTIAMTMNPPREPGYRDPRRSQASCGPSGSHAPRKRTDDVDAQAASCRVTAIVYPVLPANVCRVEVPYGERANIAVGEATEKESHELLPLARQTASRWTWKSGSRRPEIGQTLLPSWTHEKNRRRSPPTPRHCPRWPGIAGFLQRNIHFSEAAKRVRASHGVR